MSQWYAYLPGALTVTVAVAPPAMSPLSNALSSAVTVCVTPSALLILIVVPGATCNVAGENVKFEITTVAPFDLAPDDASDPGALVADRVTSAVTAAIRGTTSAS